MYHTKDVYTNKKGAKAPAASKMSLIAQHQKTASAEDAVARASFSSVRERDADLAQTFTLSKISSYSQNPQAEFQRLYKDGANETAVSDELSTPSTPLSLPGTPRASFSIDNMLLAQGKQFPSPLEDNNAAAPTATAEWLTLEPSESVLDTTRHLASCAHEADPSANVADADADTAMEDVHVVEPVPSLQPFESLPYEIFRQIVGYLALDTPPNGIDRRNVDLASLLVTSKAVSAKAVEALYRRVIIPHSRNFNKFHTQLQAYPFRGVWVRRLDFSHFNPVSLFRTASARNASQNLTAHTLVQCLNLTPSLREFLVQDYLDTDIDEAVIHKLLAGLPCLEALDMCGCTSDEFRNGFVAVMAHQAEHSVPETLSIKRLSLHKCLTLPTSVFDFLLPRLIHLTHLDLSTTRVTDAALQKIPHTARISHLNLAKCSLLTVDGVIDFLAHHPAVNQGTLQFLSLGYEASTFQLFDCADISRLLSVLPSTLKSLTLKGSKMDASHIPRLVDLAKHLEELSLGRGLSLTDVCTIVVPPKAGDQTAPTAYHGARELRFLDLTDMDPEHMPAASLLLDGLLLDKNSLPLEVIEVSDSVYQRVAKSPNALARLGWRQSEIGSRSWLVRGTEAVAGRRSTVTMGRYQMENGLRPWKMGAQSWGMRKIPVAHAKVGGMYGSYMFGRKL